MGGMGAEVELVPPVCVAATLNAAKWQWAIRRSWQAAFRALFRFKCQSVADSPAFFDLRCRRCGQAFA